MKVLHLCPLWFPIAENAPGGIETFLASLVGPLDALGCKSTLLAAGDSTADADLIPVLPSGIQQQMAAGTIEEQIYYEQHQLQLAIRYAAGFDIIHSHVGPGAFVLSHIPGIGNRVLHTQHTPVYRDLTWLVRQHPGVWFSTVSEFQAHKLPESARCEVIHNGIRISDFKFQSERGEGLLFMGRIEHTKGADLAIHAAQQTGLPLTLAGPIIDGGFFEKEIKPHLNASIRYAGILNHAQKVEAFGSSACVVLPFRGEEPFGLVSIEAMACGTPVVALANGALPEIIDNGQTGYLAKTEDQLAGLIELAMSLDRSGVRKRAAERFDIALTAKKYLRLYERIASEESNRPALQKRLTP